MSYFAYIRVSTTRQGERGVSLNEQRAAIERYAARNGLTISRWFEERVTAAKRGRPIFGQMLKDLARGRSQGVVIHKVDRSARNLRDWAEIGDLQDRGVAVHFASDGIDLNTRSGRLSADIQAVVAADYIRNLKEEALKGLYGRLKQGLYPFPAPIGYDDRGEGQPKEINPVAGPIVRSVCELYASGKYSLNALVEEAYSRGLRNRRGGKVSKNSLSALLNNPFYAGIIRIKRNGQTFSGLHQPLIPIHLHKRIQLVLRGKAPQRVNTHNFLFSRMISCSRCGRSLVGERQKGHVYYRCHTTSCKGISVRESAVETAARACLLPVQFSAGEITHLRAALARLNNDWAEQHKKTTDALRLQLNQLDIRLNRLIDAYVDGLVEKQLFESRKGGLVVEQQDLREKLREVADSSAGTQRLENLVEQCESAYERYNTGLPEEKREILEIVTSNRNVEGKNVHFKRFWAFERIVERRIATCGGAERENDRTWDELLIELIPSTLMGEIKRPSPAWSHT
jgi:site-specific DNA recombinase